MEKKDTFENHENFEKALQELEKEQAGPKEWWCEIEHN